MTGTPEHLRRALANNPADPLLTYYDDATGERVELSATTLANWVAKTVNLLVLECGVGPGSRLALHLPRHWTTAVWVLAADAVGAEVRHEPGIPSPAISSPAIPVDVAVVGPDGLDELPLADEVFAVSLAPMAAPFTQPLPVLVRDYSIEVRAMPDQVGGPVGPAGSLGAFAEQSAAEQGLEPTDRVAGHGTLAGLPGLVDEWLAPLAVGASVLWVRNPDPSLCVRRWATERVTAISGTPPNGVRLPEAIRLLA